jgi:hypothetical protein
VTILNASVLRPQLGHRELGLTEVLGELTEHKMRRMIEKRGTQRVREEVKETLMKVRE